MRISYFLPIYDEDEAIKFLQKFTASDFFNQYEDREIILAMKQSDKGDEIKKVMQNFCDTVVLQTDKEFSFNDAFHKAVEVITGDVCLFLDSKVMNIEPLLRKCMSKYDKEAKIVFVSKNGNKFKEFFKKNGLAIYRFFTNIFVNKSDKCNVITLGLIDRSIVKLLLAIPNKRCLLKNTDKFYGIKTATIYIDEKIKTTDSTKGKMTSGLWTFIWSTTIFAYLFLTTLILDIIFHLPSFVKIPLIFCIIFSFIVSSFAYPKHIFLIRNFPLGKIGFSVEKFVKNK